MGRGGGSLSGSRGPAAAGYRAEVLAQREAFFAKSGLSASELRNLAQLVRTVSHDATSMTFDIATPDPAPTFKSALVLPKSAQAPAQDGPPRTTANKLQLFWLYKTRGVVAPQLNAGARLDIDGLPFELVTGGRAMRYGQTIHAWRADVLPVNALWPLTAELQELGGATVTSNVPLAIWEGDQEVVKGRGLYDQISGEIPCDFLADVTPIRNRQLVVGSFVFRITAAMPHFQQPAVKLRLTRSDDG